MVEQLQLELFGVTAFLLAAQPARHLFCAKRFHHQANEGVARHVFLVVAAQDCQRPLERPRQGDRGRHRGCAPPLFERRYWPAVAGAENVPKDDAFEHRVMSDEGRAFCHGVEDQLWHPVTRMPGLYRAGTAREAGGPALGRPMF